MLGLVSIRGAECPAGETIRLAVMATVLLSFFGHGLSAKPGIGLFARFVATFDADAPEHEV